MSFFKKEKKTMIELHDAVEFNNLIYHYKGPTKDVDFSNCNDAKSLFNMIKNKDIRLINAEENQPERNAKLNNIKLGDKKIKCTKKVIKNVKKFYDSQESIINFYKDYYLMVINAAYDAKQGTGLKILTSKQMLQRLPIALAQVKAGNNRENLLNEIRQIVYSLCQSKEITKKYAGT